MNLGRPFLPADRTPLVLHIERLRSVPPLTAPPDGGIDTAAMVVLWLLLGGAVTVMVAVLLVAFAAWLDNGGTW